MNFDRLTEFQNELTENRVPGNDIAVSVGGKTVFRRQSGYSDVGSGTKMRGDELYFLWSGTKLFTSSLAMRLWEEGHLSLDAPVGDYLQEFGRMSVLTQNGTVPATEKITVRNLLTMTAGLDYNLSMPDTVGMKKETDGKCPTRDVMRRIAEKPLLFEPGTHFSYGMSHDVLGGVIEAVTGKRLRDYAREVLFDPLGMNDTFYGQPDEKQQERMAAQYIWREDLKKAVPMKKTCVFIFGEEYDSGGAGAVSTCDDFMKFAKTVANGGKAESGYGFLSRDTIDEWRRDALTPVQYADFRRDWGEGYSYALGVRTMIDHAGYGATDSVFDFGWGGAAGMRVFIAPDENIAAVYMMHLHGMPDDREFERRLRNTVFRCVDE